jgi:membrane protease YdiL (CAAX protease family)
LPGIPYIHSYNEGMRIGFVLHPNNRLFTLARLGGRQPSALVAIALVLVVLALVVIPGQILGRLVVRLAFPGASIFEDTIGFLAVYPALWVWLRIANKRPFRSLGFEIPGAPRRILRGALAAGLMVAVTAGLAIIPGASVERGAEAMGPVALGVGLLSLLSSAVQSSAEEVLFRGWLLPVIGARYGPWIGVLVSSLLFSLAHVTNSRNPLALLNLFLFGVFAAFYALAEGGLWGICAWHTVWNWAQGSLLGFTVSGGAHAGLLVSIRASGPDMITGGAFGLEGGVAATAVLLIATGMIALKAHTDGGQVGDLPY